MEQPVITVTNAVPTVMTAAVASPAVVSGTTTFALCAGRGHRQRRRTAPEIRSGSHLDPQWRQRLPVFSQNGTNASKNTTATFSSAGTYAFTCTVTDIGGASTTSSVNVTVNQTPSVITLAPATASLPSGATVQLTVNATTDQFGSPFNNSSITWTLLSGIGSVSAGGVYTAPIGSAGSATVQASAGGVNGTATITVTPVVNGVWTNPAGGSWIASANWQGGGIPQVLDTRPILARWIWQRTRR